MKNKTYIIAEAGVNHNGSLKRAIELVDAAVDAGVDAIKFQTFKSENIVSRFAPKAEYQKNASVVNETQMEMLKKLELNEAKHISLKNYCIERSIEFLSTPFDISSLNFLITELEISKIKIASGEITNGPLLLRAAKSGKPVILSTGMCTLDEIETALGILAYGYIGSNESLNLQTFRLAFQSEKGQIALKEKVTLMHCTTEYPAPVSDVNLLAITSLQEYFGLPVGYSDHSQGIFISIAAVTLGALVIEKHFTIDRNLPGPDHYASLEPKELKEMVKAVRDVQTALGSPIKQPSSSEMKNKPVVRKSLVAARDIRKGELLTEENIGVKRPGDGISPIHYWELLGRVAEKDYRMDEKIL